MASEMGEVLAANVAQFDPLEVVPDALVRIEVWGVAGELLQADAVGSTLGQEVLDRLATMDGSTIPDDQELAGNMSEQVLEEADDIRTLVRVVLHAHEQLTGRRDATDHGQMIAAQWETEDGCLATRGVGANRPGEEVEARFIDPDDGSPLLVSLLFRAGQRSVRQSSMVASFRWLARVIGFCTLQPAAHRSLPT